MAQLADAASEALAQQFGQTRARRRVVRRRRRVLGRRIGQRRRRRRIRRQRRRVLGSRRGAARSRTAAGRRRRGRASIASRFTLIGAHDVRPELRSVQQLHPLWTVPPKKIIEKRKREKCTQLNMVILSLQRLLLTNLYENTDFFSIF